MAEFGLVEWYDHDQKADSGISLEHVLGSCSKLSIPKSSQEPSTPKEVNRLCTCLKAATEAEDYATNYNCESPSKVVAGWAPQSGSKKGTCGEHGNDEAATKG